MHHLAIIFVLLCIAAFPMLLGKHKIKYHPFCDVPGDECILLEGTANPQTSILSCTWYMCHSKARCVRAMPILFMGGFHNFSSFGTKAAQLVSVVIFLSSDYLW